MLDLVKRNGMPGSPYQHDLFDEIRNLGVHGLFAYNGNMSIHITTIPPF